MIILLETADITISAEICSFTDFMRCKTFEHVRSCGDSLTFALNVLGQLGKTSSHGIC